MVRLRATEFGMVTHVEQERVFADQPSPHLKGAGPQHPPNFWDFIHARTQYEKRQ